MSYASTYKSSSKTTQVKKSGKIKLAAIAVGAVAIGGIAYSLGAGVAGNKEGFVVAKVNGEKIYSSQLEQEYNIINKQTKQPVPFESLGNTEQEAIIRQYIAQNLLLQNAKEAKIDHDVAVKKQINKILKDAYLKQMVESSVTVADVQERYNELAQSLEGKEQLTLRHILVESEEEAGKVLKKINKDKSNFASLAKKHSIDKNNADKGGELGDLLSGTMLPEFEEAVFELKKGELSKPVKTVSGWHIILLDNRKPAEAAPFEQVKANLAKELSERLVKEHVNQLVSEADINILLEK